MGSFEKSKGGQKLPGLFLDQKWKQKSNFPEGQLSANFAK